MKNKTYKRKVSDEKIIKCYIENKSYKKVSGLLKCTEWNVRKVIQANREIVPELKDIQETQLNNFTTYYDYKRSKSQPELSTETQDQQGCITDISAIDAEILQSHQPDNILYNNNIYNNNNIPDIYNNINIKDKDIYNNNIIYEDNNINNINNIYKDNEDREIIHQNSIISKIDDILEIALKKLKATIKKENISSKDYSEIINKLISKKLELNNSKKDDKKGNNTINIFGSPQQAMKLLKEMQKINKNNV